MKKILILFLSFGLSGVSYATDTLSVKSIDLKDTAVQMEDLKLTSVLKEPGTGDITYNQLIADPVKMPGDTNYYYKGKLDAQKFHRKRGLGNFGLGCLGPWGFLGVVISPAKKPDINDIKNEALLKNPEYLKGYKQVAKSKNIGNAALGLVTIVIVGTVVFALIFLPV